MMGGGEREVEGAPTVRGPHCARSLREARVGRVAVAAQGLATGVDAALDEQGGDAETEAWGKAADRQSEISPPFPRLPAAAHPACVAQVEKALRPADVACASGSAARSPESMPDIRPSYISCG